MGNEFRAARRAAALGPPSPHVLVTEIDGDLALYDAERNEVHVLNVSAGDIWRLLDGERDLDEIVALIAEAYSAHPDDVRPDVAAAVATFVDRGLLPAGRGG